MRQAVGLRSAMELLRRGLYLLHRLQALAEGIASLRRLPLFRALLIVGFHFLLNGMQQQGSLLGQRGPPGWTRPGSAGGWDRQASGEERLTAGFRLTLAVRCLAFGLAGIATRGR